MSEFDRLIYFAWTWRAKASWLCLKQHGPTKAIVVRLNPGAIVGRNMARIYEGWIGDRMVFDPYATYEVGQVLKMDVV